LRIGANLNGFSRLYADYNIRGSDMTLNGKSNIKPTWRVPGAATVDVQASYKFRIVNAVDITISGTCKNLFNQTYISDAMDVGTGTWYNARVFYGFGRTWTARLKVSF